MSDVTGSTPSRPTFFPDSVLFVEPDLILAMKDGTNKRRVMKLKYNDPPPSLSIVW